MKAESILLFILSTFVRFRFRYSFFDFGTRRAQLFKRQAVQYSTKRARHALGSVRAIWKGKHSANARQRANGVLKGVFAYMEIMPCHCGA